MTVRSQASIVVDSHVLKGQVQVTLTVAAGGKNTPHHLTLSTDTQGGRSAHRERQLLFIKERS